MSPYNTLCAAAIRGCLLLCLLSAQPGIAQIDPRLEPVATGFSEVTAVRSPHDASGRLFVVEREGFIHIVNDQQQTLTPAFLDIDDLTDSVSEYGLVGLAFHPDYLNNGYFYVNFDQSGVDPEPNLTTVMRFQVDGQNPNLADRDSATVIITIEQPFGNHNGGDMHFGPDGMLYIAMGDGGGSGDPGDRAQDMTTLLGKMLRLDVDNPGANTTHACRHNSGVYGIPADNPFINGPQGACAEIWASGLRNPFRFSFDRQTGDLFIADVGQERIEEVNLQSAASAGGENYGWDCFEGSTVYGQAGDPGTPATSCQLNPVTIDPVMEYSHANNRCSITGGFRFRGPERSYRGHYVFADLCTTEVFLATEVATNSWSFDTLTTHTGPITSFGEDQAGNLYVVDYSQGIYQLTDANGLIFTSGFDTPW